MCGVAGLWNMPMGREVLEKTAGQMIRTLRHRGPDGETVTAGDGWALGHSRLSIIDLQNGGQPMWNEDRTVALIGNNEIYNFPELRQELEARGHRFSSHCDTEVAVHGWEEWGEECFARMKGMFAFALIDTKKKVCVLARDPLGIKPLHWARVGQGVLFGSEVKAFFPVPSFQTQPDRDAMHLFMNFRYLPNEQTLFKGVERVAPGSVMVFSQEGMTRKSFFNWDSGSGTAVPKYTAATEQLRGLLQAGVRRHLLADVEVGTYLSSGIDSSLVTTLAAREQPGLKSFCLAFGESTDENEEATRLARQVGTTHQNLQVGTDPFLRFSDILWHVEEPKVNCLQGFLLAQSVAPQIRVALSGLGGDDLFAGYINNDILYPMSLMGGHAKAVHGLNALQKLLGAGLGWDVFVRSGELGLNAANPLAFYSILRNSFDHNSYWLNALYVHPPEHWKNYSIEALRVKFDEKNPDTLNALLNLEARTKLVNDFLLTEDRVSMAHSLEVRVPLLDQDVTRFALSLPSSYKYRPGKKKRIMRDAAAAWLPRDVLNRKKRGFSFNPYVLFQGPLRQFAVQVLTKKRVEAMDLFSWTWIQEVLNASPSPRLRWHYFNLWVMAGFVLWHERFFGDSNGRR